MGLRGISKRLTRLNMTLDFENIWIRGGQPVKTEWLDGCAKVDVSILNWEKLAILRCGRTELSIETALATPSGHWLRVSGLIDGAAAGSRGNIGWRVTGDAGVEVPAKMANCWSEVWLAWRHGEIDSHMLVDRLNLHAGNGMESSVWFPQHFRRVVKSLGQWQLPITILTAIALGFLAGWISCSLHRFTKVSQSPTHETIDFSVPSKEQMISNQVD